jgi:geranylgeranyl diphosphate synthase type II
MWRGTLLGLDESKALARELVAQALNAIEHFDKKADALRAIAAYVIERKH